MDWGGCSRPRAQAVMSGLQFSQVASHLDDRHGLPAGSERRWDGSSAKANTRVRFITAEHRKGSVAWVKFSKRVHEFIEALEDQGATVIVVLSDRAASSRPAYHAVPPSAPVNQTQIRFTYVHLRQREELIVEIKIVGVDHAGVTEPRNDGTRGSGLYTVPFILSDGVPEIWVEAFVHTWNNLPSYTTRHRPGIARVSVDRVYLEGTTIEEVEEVHLATLSSV